LAVNQANSQHSRAVEMKSRMLSRFVRNALPANRRFCSSVLGKRPDEDKNSQLSNSKLAVTSLAAAGLMTTKAGFTMSAGMVTAICNAPKVAFAMMLSAPILTCHKIWKDGSVGDLSAFPFVSLIGNCGVWTTYGLICSDPTIYQANLAGFIAGCIFTGVYSKNGSIPMQYWAFAGGMNALAAGCYFGLDAETALSILGSAGAGTAIILLSSPLVVMKTIIANQDSSPMPWQTSVAMFLNASAWATFGITVANDLFVTVPNGFGAAAGLVQIALILKYPPKKA